ncbi:heavy metal translocating P-type ATPase metal-binding domain-containing protein [Limibacter armeniacum]|uniref:heavy metal translocating P-type ATPase n=1 Tax=Limibacter armeniacum TaxID=466084 RepID=UPI002FE5AD64
MEIKEQQVCYHCGENCDEDILHYEDKSFCCNGCQMVYQLLNEHELTNYYCINEQPGTQQKKRTPKEKFAYLEDESIRRRLIEFSDGNITKISFYLPQVHCSSCVWLLEKLPQLHEGIANSKINFMKRELYVNFHEDVLSLRQLVELLTNLGYEPLINLEDLDKKQKKKKASTQTNAFLVKLGVTGFCFGNIMLLSFPEYLGINQADQHFVEIFGYLNLILSLPVFFYGASDYLKSAWSALSHKTVNIDVPISLGILALFLRSTYEILSDTGAGYLDSLAALIFLLLVGKWFQQKTFDNISFERDYKSYFPIAVTTMRNGKEETIPISKLKENDTLLIRNGELIPADAILLKGDAHIDYSFVTGESQPVPKASGDLIYAGGKQRGGMIELQMVKEVSQSYLTRLWNDSAFTENRYDGLDNWTNKISKAFTLAVLLIATGAAISWWSSGVEVAINSFTAVLIIACPCALALNVPFTLGNALRVLARNGIYLKDTNAIERFSRITHIIFDKTGTITSAENESVSFEGTPLMGEEEKLVSALVHYSTHPVSKQIDSYFKNTQVDLTVQDFQEVEGTGISGLVDGVSIKLGKASFVSQKREDKPQKEVLVTTAHLSIGGLYRGKFVMKQQLRNGVQELITQLSGKYKLSLLSGDNEGERAKLSEIFGEGNELRFNQSPQDKMNYVKELQLKGEQVMMIGDGLNDAGALRQANIGVAVAENVHQFSPACDAILSAKQLSQFGKLFGYGRACLKVVYVGFVLSLLYNIVGLAFAITGNLSPIVAAILMPLSSVTVVGVGTLLSTLKWKK